MRAVGSPGVTAGSERLGIAAEYTLRSIEEGAAARK